MIKVLDYGFVRLIDHMGTDVSVVRAARNSHDAAWRAGADAGSDTKLINYLWKHQHSTPFEAATFTFEVKAPIFVLRQWHRHRTQSYNEVSARYTELPEEFYTPEPEAIGTQSTNNRQGRMDGGDLALREHQVDRYRNRCTEAFQEYKCFLMDGWPRELARCVLPLSTYSKMFATMNLWNLLKFLTLRCDKHAQYEIRVSADAMRDLVNPHFPVCIAAWESTNQTERPR